MNPEKDPYYYQLAPYLDEFRRGCPVLVYHKLGFSSLMASEKGLWISPRLFARQLAELKAAGFSGRELDSGVESGPGVVITFDDGYVSAFRHALEPLRENGFSAIQFLTSGFLGKTSSWDNAAEPLMDRAQVRDWLQAGHSIGAHTVNHVRLTQVGESVAREEITAGRKFLEDEFGVGVRHFCYPYGDWNRRVAEWVAEAGYATASTTEFGVNTGESDWFALKRIHAYVPLRSLPGAYYFLRR
jgi:peptidoglycan/xylan/chitin deacetylase (PgdA/CDA1 family)